MSAHVATDSRAVRPAGESGRDVVVLEVMVNPERIDGTPLDELADELLETLSSLPKSEHLDIGSDMLEMICSVDATWRESLIMAIPVEFHMADDYLSVREFFLASEVDFKISAYELSDSKLMNCQKLQDATVYEMPHRTFETTWDDLIFDNDIKSSLFWSIRNMLKTPASTNTIAARRRMNPLLLLHGPPGTGKTTLAYALAQKVAVRLNYIYPETKLVMLRAQSLLSFLFGESPKKIDSLFAAIRTMCEEAPSSMHFILIDEVEGMAASRQAGDAKGEKNDSLRATNALLTGLDSARGITNVFFLFTTNMLSCIDEAFRDRCRLTYAVDPPSLPSSYTILRNGILELLKSGEVDHEDETDVHVDHILDTYDAAALFSQMRNESYTGFQLLEIVKLLQKVFKNGPSGRYLTQLPDMVVLKNKRYGPYFLSRLLNDMHGQVSREARNQGSNLYG